MKRRITEHTISWRKSRSTHTWWRMRGRLRMNRHKHDIISWISHPISIRTNISLSMHHNNHIHNRITINRILWTCTMLEWLCLVFGKMATQVGNCYYVLCNFHTVCFLWLRSLGASVDVFCMFQCWWMIRKCLRMLMKVLILNRWVCSHKCFLVVLNLWNVFLWTYWDCDARPVVYSLR